MVSGEAAPELVREPASAGPEKRALPRVTHRGSRRLRPCCDGKHALVAANDRRAIGVALAGVGSRNVEVAPERCIHGRVLPVPLAGTYAPPHPG